MEIWGKPRNPFLVNNMRPILALLGIFLGACAFNYSTGALSYATLGETKQDFIKQYQRSSMQGPLPRASKIDGADTIEVMTMPMEGPDRRAADYWFLFKNNRLVQWGRPEDWQSVAATYRVDFNPLPSASRP